MKFRSIMHSCSVHIVKKSIISFIINSNNCFQYFSYHTSDVSIGAFNSGSEIITPATKLFTFFLSLFQMNFPSALAQTPGTDILQ